MNNIDNKNINIMVCGYVNTGKTSLVNRIITGRWDPNLKITDMLIPGWNKSVFRTRYMNNLKFTVDREIEEEDINKYDMFVILYDNNGLTRAYAREFSKMIPTHKKVLVYSKNDTEYENEDRMGEDRSIIVSSKTGKNVDKLMKAIYNKLV